MWAVCAWADNQPLRDLSGLANPKPEQMVRATSARVILADYELIQEDFPETRVMSHSEIDQWLLHQTAFVSKGQAAQEDVNTKIPTSSEERVAYRPKEYGRGVVFEIGKSGLIDVKGVGALYPMLGDHSNGLLSLGESIREFAYEKLVRKIFKHSKSRFATVRTYAVTDLGFDIKNKDGTLSRAGSVLRQGNKRSKGFLSLLDDQRALRIEKLLRRYGVTSAGAHRNEWPYEWLNVQGTRDAAVIDFGGFLTVDKFEKPLVHPFQNMTLSPPLVSAAEVKALQPDPLIRVPLETWGSTITGNADPAFDNPSVWSHQLVEGLRNGTATRADVEQHLRNLLEPVDRIFAAHPVADPIEKFDSKSECLIGITGVLSPK